MSKIKSALDLALERTAGIQVDRESLLRDEWIRKGKSAAGRYLESPEDSSLEEQSGGLEEKNRACFVQGALKALLANLTLPRFESDLARIPLIAKGLTDLGGSKEGIQPMMTQIEDLLKQYLVNLEQLENQLKSQWEPRMRQKEEQLKQQLGQAVRLSPEQDPEFVKVLSQELSRMDAEFNQVLKQGKAELQKMIPAE